MNSGLDYDRTKFFNFAKLKAIIILYRVEKFNNIYPMAHYEAFFEIFPQYFLRRLMFY